MYDALPAVLEARYRAKSLLDLDNIETAKGMVGEIIEYLNTAVRAMSKGDLALISEVKKEEKDEMEAA